MEKLSFKTLRQRGLELRESLIIEAAIEAMSESSFYKVRISDISEKVGIPSRTIYHYFDSKEELIARSFLTLLTKFEEQISFNELNNSSTPLHNLAENLIDFSLENRTFFQLFLFFVTSSIDDDEISQKIKFKILVFFEKNEFFFRKMGYSGDIKSVIHGFYWALGGVISSYRNDISTFEKPKKIKEKLVTATSMIADIFQNKLVHVSC